MANDMFIKIGDIAGESVDKTHAGEIDVIDWCWGASNSGTSHIGGGSGSGKCSVQDLSFTKYIDKASPTLALATCSGKHFETALLVQRKAGDKPLEYLKLKLSKVLVSSVSLGSTGSEERPTESVTLNFGAISYEYITQKADGGKGEVTVVNWNVAKNVSE